MKAGAIWVLAPSNRFFNRTRRGTIPLFCLGLLYVLATSANANEQSPPKTSNIIDEADMAVIADITQQLKIIRSGEAAAKERISEVYSIFEKAISQLKGDESRAVLCELHSDCARMFGDQEESMRRLRQIIEQYPTTSRYSPAIDQLIDHYQRKADYAEMLVMATDASRTAATEPRRIHFKGKMAFAMTALGQTDEAMKMLLEELDRFPGHSRLVLRIVNDIAAMAVSNNDHENSYLGFKTIYAKAAPGQRSLQQLGNLATACQLSKRTDEAEKIYLEAIAAFPDDERRPEKEFSIAFLRFGRGDFDGARQYYEKVLASKSSYDGLSDLKKLARSNLEIIDNRNRKAVAALVQPSSNRPVAIWLPLNLALIAILSFLVAWKKRKRRADAA